MGVTAKDVGILIWKVLKFTMRTFYYFVLKYPIVSCILLFFILIYIFLPSVFTFLIYFSPLVVFAGLVHRVFLEIDRRKKVQISKEDEKKNDGILSRNLKYVANELAVDTNVNFSAGTTARRRIAKEGIKEENAVSSIDDNVLIDKSALVEENLKEIREVKVDSEIARTECSSSKPEIGDTGTREEYEKFTNSKSETEKESPDDTEDDDDEEEEEEDDEQEERNINKAVEWTEDDQKNLMDLGLSEIERNKRLESLIARRRSRKYMSLQGRRTMGSHNNFNPQISSIQIPKTNPFLVGSSNQFSPVPGSAPSVLLPTNNPFDLPYDPFEEKPNLTGGMEEFIAPNQKDMMFCRHESFHMNAFLPPESKNGKHEIHHDFFTRQRIFERPPLPTPDAEQFGKKIQHKFPSVAAQVDKKDTSSNQGLEESSSPEQVVDSDDHHNKDDESDVQTKEMVVDSSSSSNTSSPCSCEATEQSEPVFRPIREAILKSISQLSQKNMVVEDNNESYDSGSSDLGKTKVEHFFHPNMARMRHTPSHSIASDLQVEVSELGSPSLTNISSQDEASSTNDGDTEKEITSGSEEMWGTSSHLSGVDENESRSRAVHEVSEQDIIDVGFSKDDDKSNPFASHDLPEKVVEQDTADSHISLPSKPELTQDDIQQCRTNGNLSVHETELVNASDSLEISSSQASEVPVPGSPRTSAGEMTAAPANYNVSVEPEESANPENFEKELKGSESVSVSDSEVPVKNDKEDLRAEVEVSNKSETLMQDEYNGNLSIPQSETNTMPTESGEKVEKQLEHKYNIDSSKPHEEEDISTSLKHLEKDVFEVSESSENVKKPSQYREVDHDISESDLVNPDAAVSHIEVSTGQTSTINLDKEMHEEVQTSNAEIVQSSNLDEQGSTDGGISHSSSDHIESTEASEQVDTAAPSSSSPDSVLHPTFSIDQGLSTLTEVPRSESVIGEAASQDQDTLTPPAPAAEDAVHLTYISQDGQGHEGDSVKVENSVNPLVTSPQEVSRNDIDNESIAEEGETQIRSMLETTAELLSPGNDTGSKDTETMIENIAETISPDPQSLPSTNQEEQSDQPRECSADELTINPTAYDSNSETGEIGSKSVGGESESINRQSSVHNHFSRNSEDFIEDLFGSLVGPSTNASVNVTRQSSAHEFSRSSEDFLQDLFKSLVTDASGGGASNRTSRQGSLQLESSESTDDMVQEMFKSLKDNPRE